MTHDVSPIPTLWAVPPLMMATVALAEATPDPTLQWLEYGVMGLVILALGWWSVRRENQSDKLARENQDKIISMTEKTVEAITETKAAISECRSSIDRQTESNRALEFSQIENGKKVDKLCETIDRTHPRKPKE